MDLILWIGNTFEFGDVLILFVIKAFTAFITNKLLLKYTEKNRYHRIYIIANIFLIITAGYFLAFCT